MTRTRTSGSVDAVLRRPIGSLKPPKELPLSFLSSRRGTGRTALASLVLGAMIAIAAPAVAGAQNLDIVADGLSNPRGLSFAPDGNLYVAEAGRGGSGACIASPEGGESCYGATGGITRINVRRDTEQQIISRLPSLASQEAAEGMPAGSNAIGPQDVSFNNRWGYFTVGLGANPDARSQLGSNGRRFGLLNRFDRKRKVSRVADIAAYEAKNNPDASQPDAQVDSNPFSVDASASNRILVTDAGGNSLLRVRRTGEIRTLAWFPFGQTLAPPFLGLPPGTQIPYQSVPTGVVRGPDGAAHLGQLTGFPFPAGAANVFRVVGAETPSVQATGFTTVVDVAYGPDGSFYVLQISSNGLAAQPPGPGKLLRIDDDGTQTELAAGRLQEPTGLTVARNGDIYVSNQGSSPNDGQVVRIPAPED